MSKIAIISQPDQGVLIDVSGCSSLKEAYDHLSSTLQESNQFWQGMNVSVNLGALEVEADELKKIIAIAKGVGINPAGIYATNDTTRDALRKSNVPLGAGKPMTLPTVSLDESNVSDADSDDSEKQKSTPFATIKMRIGEVVARRSSKENVVAEEQPSELEDMDRIETDADEKTDHASTFPHVKLKRRVSLDGKPVEERSKAKKTPGKSSEVTVSSTTAIESPAAESKLAICAETDNNSSCDLEDTQDVKAQPVEVKVMTIQVTESMMEAQPANTAIAQATITGDVPIVEVVTQIDQDCDQAAEVSASAQASPTIDEEVDDVEEELEADSLEIDTNARGGPTTLYLRQNLRSGQTVSHKGHLVIIGDINPGAEVMADGDITVWGCLRGVAHAGIGGNVNAEIRALKLQPIQIRIAHAIARAPDRPRVNYATTNGPETARMVDGKIKVVRSRIE